MEKDMQVEKRGLFNKLWDAASGILKPADEEDYIEEDEENTYMQEENSERQSSVRESKAGRKKTGGRAKTQRSAPVSTGKLYGGYIEEDEIEDEYVPRYSTADAGNTGSPTYDRQSGYYAPQDSFQQPSYMAAGTPREEKTSSAKGGFPGNVFNMADSAASHKYKFSYIKVDKVEVAMQAANEMLAGNTVTLLDFRDMQDSLSRRVIDFLDGVRYTCEARIEVVSDLIYVLVPKSVELSGDFQSQVDIYGFHFEQ